MEYDVSRACYFFLYVETEETLKRRLSAAERELVFAQQFPFHLTIVNDDLRTSFKHLVQHVTEHYPDLHANYIPPPSDLFSTPTPPSSL